MNLNLVTDAKFAFVIAEGKPPLTPNRFDNEPTKWQSFVAKIEGLSKRPEGMIVIHENVWLIPLATGLLYLARIVESAPSYDVSIRILLLEDIPTWLKYPPDAEVKSS